jgi:hypothetical protein
VSWHLRSGLTIFQRCFENWKRVASLSSLSWLCLSVCDGDVSSSLASSLAQKQRCWKLGRKSTIMNPPLLKLALLF